MAMATQGAAKDEGATIPYRHDIDDCLAARIGDGGLSDAGFDAALAETVPVLEGLRARHAAGELPLFDLPRRGDDLDALAAVARRMRARFYDLVVLGSGGSSLGGQTLAALADGAATPRLRFADNIDPQGFAALIDGLDLDRAGFLAVSKSGATAATLAQVLIAIDALRAAVGERGVGDRITAIVEPGESPLRRVARRWGIETLDHDPGLGGRFSALSLVGLLPAMVAGLDAEALRAGAAAVLDATLGADHPRDAAPAAGAAVTVGLMRERGITATVLMPYADRLEPFAEWYCQLWAESLGKGGAGITPLRAIGATDQHSQLQLYLDGPRDKMVTLVTLERAGSGARIAADLAADAALAYLGGKTIGDLMDAEQRATADALAANGRPVRVIRLARLDERGLGALLMHFMLETLIAAGLLGVNPFDQPAVEQGKAFARAYLAGDQAP